MEWSEDALYEVGDISFHRDTPRATPQFVGINASGRGELGTVCSNDKVISENSQGGCYGYRYKG